MAKNKHSTMQNHKKQIRYHPTRKPAARQQEPVSTISKNLSITGTVYCGEYKFSCGHTVPLYEVLNVHAFNQIIGYAKFINKAHGDVYYRGECKLHNSVKPSVFRNCVNTAAISGRLNSLIDRIVADPRMKHQLKITTEDIYSAKYTVEAMLQHYGVATRFVDVVDNHWIALWMGLYKSETMKQIDKYSHYNKREIPIVDFARGKELPDEDIFQYILLLAVPGQETRLNNGIYVSDDYIEIDLRQALPSIFLRPHAQHGLVIRKRPHEDDSPAAYDMADSVIGILKIRIDRAQDWIGTGQLLTQNNLFPPPAYDQGYDILLSRNDIFDSAECSIIKYI